MIQPIWTSLVERSLVSGPKSALCNAWAFGLELLCPIVRSILPGVEAT